MSDAKSFALATKEPDFLPEVFLMNDSERFSKSMNLNNLNMLPEL